MKSTVLLIEDNEQNIYLATFLLRTGGFEVVQARNGVEAIFSARQAVPDLILLDIELPGMDGYAVARELRQQHSLASVPIVAVTSYAMVGDREKALAAGCTDYIEKPINPDTFVTQVTQHLPAGKGGGSCPES
jgi:two-component system, cell cycle response regulator DivK